MVDHRRRPPEWRMWVNCWSGNSLTSLVVENQKIFFLSIHSFQFGFETQHEELLLKSLKLNQWSLGSACWAQVGLKTSCSLEFSCLVLSWFSHRECSTSLRGTVKVWSGYLQKAIMTGPYWRSRNLRRIPKPSVPVEAPWTLPLPQVLRV